MVTQSGMSFVALLGLLSASGFGQQVAIGGEQGGFDAAGFASVAQQAYLKASNTGLYDGFGFAVAASGDTLVVGAPAESSSATGVNGDEADDSAYGAGAVYVFVRSGGSWVQQAYLKASNTAAGDHFGSSVFISGDTLVVGATGEDSTATGVDGTGTDPDPLFDSGAAYVFVRSGTAWSQQAYLKASNTGAGDFFGHAVAVSGDTVVVGANAESSGATGVNGDDSDDGTPYAGAAYVFVRSGTAWSQQAYVKAFNPGEGDSFGGSVALSGDTLLVGAYQEDSTAVGVNGSGIDPSLNFNAGAAYVFVRSGTGWSQQAYLKASNTGQFDKFGYAVAASGDTAVIGAYAESSKATGVNGNQSDNSAFQAGAAYVFVRSGDLWSQQAYLKASNAETGDTFGFAVALAGDALVVGAANEASGASGVNGDQGDDSERNAGAAYLFMRSGKLWSQTAYLKASNPDGEDPLTGFGDLFGRSVALSGGTLMVGAWGEDSSATGVNGDQADNTMKDAGAAYAFDQGVWIDLGFGLAGQQGLIPRLQGWGALVVGSPVSLTLTDVALQAPTVLLISLSSEPLPFKGGTLVPMPPLFAHPLMTSWSIGIDIQYPAWPAGGSGMSVYFQFAILDAAAIHGFALSNALRIDVP